MGLQILMHIEDILAWKECPKYNNWYQCNPVNHDLVCCNMSLRCIYFY